MTQPIEFTALLTKGVRFVMQNGRLNYEAKNSALSEGELLWMKRNRHVLARLVVQRELSLKRELYELCRNFQFSPFPRQLSPDCIREGNAALARIQSEIHDLVKTLERLSGETER